MSGNLLVMAKPTEQVRISTELASVARHVASAFDESLPEYVTRVLQDAVKRDFAKAQKIMHKRASSLTTEPDHPEEVE